MKAFKLSFVAAAAAVFTGCVVTSLAPFYTEKDVITDPALAGLWAQVNQDDERWLFAREDQAYRLTISSGKQTNDLSVHLFKLKDTVFMDMLGPDNSDSVPPPIPSHLLMRVYSIQPTLRMAALNHEWLKNLLQKQPETIAHQFVGSGNSNDPGRVVLTATTPQLQAFVLRYLDTTNAWSEQMELTKAETGGKTGRQPTR
jgi:hypothetical protein